MKKSGAVAHAASDRRQSGSWMGSAFRTGCKLAVVDATGKVLDTTVIYPTAPTSDAKIRAAKETLKK